jgi:hypothetical protein
LFTAPFIKTQFNLFHNAFVGKIPSVGSPAGMPAQVEIALEFRYSDSVFFHPAMRR